MLRITLKDDGEAATRLILEGRLGGPWIEELRRSFEEWFINRRDRKLIVDISDLTYADVIGTQVLNEIYAQTGAAFVTNSPWNQYLAAAITKSNLDPTNREA
jgi:anti-anti-sigma regulatory factor